MKVRTKEDLAIWIRRSLGEPTVNLPIAPEQLDDCIDEAIEFFTERCTGHGSEESYVAILPVVRAIQAAGLPSTNARVSGSAYGVAEILYQAEYQLPRNVLALGKPLDNTATTPAINGQWVTAGGGYANNDPMLNFAFASAETFNSPTLGGIAGSAMAAGLFFPGTVWADFSGFNSYGSRGGSRSQGGGVDLVTYELGLEYMEMMKQRYTIHMSCQFMEAQRKVRISPRPNCFGMLVIPVWVRVADADLYDHIWIRRYARALTMRNIGMNTGFFTGAKFPGGVEINSKKFEDEGKEEIEKCEQQIKDFDFGFPPSFVVG